MLDIKETLGFMIDHFHNSSLWSYLLATPLKFTSHFTFSHILIVQWIYILSAFCLFIKTVLKHFPAMNPFLLGLLCLSSFHVFMLSKTILPDVALAMISLSISLMILAGTLSHVSVSAIILALFFLNKSSTLVIFVALCIANITSLKTLLTYMFLPIAMILFWQWDSLALNASRHFLFPSHFLYQLGGFVLYCLNPLSFIMLIPSMIHAILLNPLHKKILLLSSGHLCLVFFFKPDINESYLHTVYRYQLPSLILLLIPLTEFLASKSPKKQFIGLSCYILGFIIPFCQFYGMTAFPFKNLNFKFSGTLFSLPFIIQYPWHLSGGLNSPTVQTLHEKHVALNAFNFLKKASHSHDSVFYLGNSSSIPFAIDKTLIESGLTEPRLNLNFYYDLRNPFVSKRQQQAIAHIQQQYPFFHHFSPIEILLRESRFVIIDTGDDKHFPLADETHMRQKLKYTWKTIKGRFTLKARYPKISGPKASGHSLEIWENHMPLLNYIAPEMSDASTESDFIIFKSGHASKDSGTHTLKKVFQNFPSYSMDVKDFNELSHTFISDKSCLIVPIDQTYSPQELWQIAKWVQQSKNIFFLKGPSFDNQSFFFPYTPYHSSHQDKHYDFLKQSMGIKPYQVHASQPASYFIARGLKPVMHSNHTSWGIEFESGLKTIQRQHIHGNTFPNRFPCGNLSQLIYLKNSHNMPSQINLSFYSFHNPLNSKSHSVLFDLYHSYNSADFKDSAAIENIALLLDLFQHKHTSFPMLHSPPVFHKEDLTHPFILRYPDKMHLNDWDVLVNGIAVSEKNIVEEGHLKFQLNARLLNQSINHVSLSFKKNPLLNLETTVVLKSDAKTHTITPSPFFGVNYYPSESYEYYLQSPDYKKMAEDFHAMSLLGINYVRLRYVHPGWYTAYGIKTASSITMNHFDTILFLLELSKHYHIKLCFDLFSLIGRDMGSSSTWRNDTKRFSDVQYVQQQDIFLKDFLKAFRRYTFDIDLINEPEIHSFETFQSWVSQKYTIIKTMAPHIQVTVGSTEPLNLQDVDFKSLHTDHFDATSSPNSNATFIQEFYVYPPQDFNVVSELKICDKLKSNFKKWKQSDFPAFILWGFAKPSNLYESANYQEYWEAELGVFQRSDRSFTHAYFTFLEESSFKN